MQTHTTCRQPCAADILEGIPACRIVVVPDFLARAVAGTSRPVPPVGWGSPNGDKGEPT